MLCRRVFRAVKMIAVGPYRNNLCAWRHNIPRPSPPPVGPQGPRCSCTVTVQWHAMRGLYELNFIF